MLTLPNKILPLHVWDVVLCTGCKYVIVFTVHIHSMIDHACKCAQVMNTQTNHAWVSILLMFGADTQSYKVMLFIVK